LPKIKIEEGEVLVYNDDNVVEENDDDKNEQVESDINFWDYSVKGFFFFLFFIFNLLDLKNMCKTKGLKNYSALLKVDLIKLLQEGIY
jgi:hypothetical protein